MMINLLDEIDLFRINVLSLMSQLKIVVKVY